MLVLFSQYGQICLPKIVEYADADVFVRLSMKVFEMITLNKVMIGQWDW